MTALDDALASSSMVLGPHQLTAKWAETSNEDIATNPDAVGQLTDQFDGVMSVTHSLDDGLPDNVTMTVGNDASGSLVAGLNGREGLTLAASGQRSYDASGTATATGALTIQATIPTTAVVGDYLLCAVVVNSATASLSQTAIDPKDNWEFLGTAVSGSGLALYIYGAKSFYTGRAPLRLVSDVAVTYIANTTAFWATNPLSVPLSYRVTNVDIDGETVAGTAHTRQGVLYGKGYQLGVWASLSGTGPWTGTLGGSTEWNEQVASGLDLMIATSPLRESGINALTANTTSSTSVAVLATVSLEPYARPRMDARQYFSPFNRDSPVFGFERDTAVVEANMRVLTTDGPVDTRIFKGQMQDVPISGRSASLVSQSRNRTWMNRTVTLPIISSNRENLSVDWLAAWLMARGGSFSGPAPSIWTRFWNPFYGSIHNGWGSDLDYNAAFNWRSDATPAGRYGTARPAIVPGPNGMPAMFGQQTATRTDEILIKPNGTMHTYPVDEFPHLYVLDDGPLMNDLFSLANSRGKVSFWMRCDPIADSPAYLTGVGGNDFRAQFYVEARNKAGEFIGFVRVTIPSDAVGKPSVTMGNTINGFGGVGAGGTSWDIPQDGNWHFFAFWWHYAAGEYAMNLDGVRHATPSTFFITNGWNDTSQLLATDAETRQAGGSVDISFAAHCPVSDLFVETGEVWVAGSGFWNYRYPFPGYGGNGTQRPTYQLMTALAEPQAVNAWDTFTDLARSSLSAYRVDENDAVAFLPQTYFGETAQMTPASVVQDVALNASDLDVRLDNSKTRNVVTVQFADLRVSSNIVDVLKYFSAITLPPGTTVMTLPLDIPAVEIHGAGFYGGNNYLFINLDAAMITTPSTIPKNRHYISANLSADGSGTMVPEQEVSARFLSVGAGSVTVEFVNKRTGAVYLTNNGDQIPFVRVLGYGVQGGPAYTTQRDTHSVALRRERGLDTTLNWVQDRDTAEDVASLLVGQLSAPRAELSLTVVGDPRRKPGQLITIKDADGTQAAGTWRILSVGHNVDGPGYTQDLRVVEQYPVAIWGGPNGWGNSVWGSVG